MTETELTREVGRLAQARGLLWHHCPDSRRCHGPKGLPDLIAVGPRGVLFAELKSEHGDISAEQDRWWWALDAAKAYGRPSPWRLWRPADLASGLIARELDAIT